MLSSSFVNLKLIFWKFFFQSVREKEQLTREVAKVFNKRESNNDRRVFGSGGRGNLELSVFLSVDLNNFMIPTASELSFFLFPDIIKQ